ncbi:glycosyltransferase family 2 protein [Actinoallomurus sp. NPDC050550]|uniref:glycosyltransferase family 2 protein n=1 Tax=Actinoallomurus sp. NPDC050550 TaxID=3154937 RepID=UPI0033F7EB27
MTGLTVIVPCYNEGAQVEEAHRAIGEALQDVSDLEFLFIDDGSTDDTLTRIRNVAADDHRVTYLSFTRNFGLEAAHAAGARYAAKPWCVQIDADLQAPPEEIRKLIAKAAEGYDVVFGIREDRDDPFIRRIGSNGMHWAARRLFGIDVPRGASSFRVIRTSVARTIADLRFGTPYFIAAVPLVGARYALVPTEHRPRTAGESKFRVTRLIGYSFELFFSYSWRPFLYVYLAAVVGVLATLLGLGSVGAALALACVAVLARYLHRFMRDQQPSRLFYVREANVELRHEDTIDGGTGRPTPPVAFQDDETARPAPPPALREVAS